MERGAAAVEAHGRVAVNAVEAHQDGLALPLCRNVQRALVRPGRAGVKTGSRTGRGIRFRVKPEHKIMRQGDLPP